MTTQSEQTETEPSLLQPEFTPEEVARFEEQGYLISRKLVSNNLRQKMLEVTWEGLARELEPIEYESDVHYPGSPESRETEGGRTARRLKQAVSRHPCFLEWINEPALKNRLHQLLGSEVVMPLAHHNCIMTKQPNYSSDTGWHQDLRYWSFPKPDLVSVWLALGEESPENGCLQLLPGSHQLQYRDEQFDEHRFFRTDLKGNQKLLKTKIDAELKPGDALFFHCRTFHAATRNHSDAPKFSAVFTFRDADNPPIPGSRSASLPELLLK